MMYVLMLLLGYNEYETVTACVVGRKNIMCLLLCLFLDVTIDVCSCWVLKQVKINFEVHSQ